MVSGFSPGAITLTADLVTDAAIDQAVEGIVNGIFFNQGHVCCAGSRLFVQESVAETVIDKLKDRIEKLIGQRPG